MGGKATCPWAGVSEVELPHAGSQNKPGLVPAGTSCSSPALFPNTTGSAKNSCVVDELRSPPSSRQGLGREGRGPCVKDTLLE